MEVLAITDVFHVTVPSPEADAHYFIKANAKTNSEVIRLIDNLKFECQINSMEVTKSERNFAIYVALDQVEIYIAPGLNAAECLMNVDTIFFPVINVKLIQEKTYDDIMEMRLGELYRKF